MLSTGAHATAKFDHPFTFETPEGWANIADRDKSYLLSASAAPESEFIVWSHAAIADQPPNCDPARKAGVGNAAADWLASLAADPRVDVSSPVPFDLGSYQAKSVEVTVKDSWTALCPFNTSPFVILVSDTGNPPTRHHGLGNDGQAYLAFIDVGGEAIVIWVDGGKGQPFASMLALAHPVIESIRFQ